MTTSRQKAAVRFCECRLQDCHFRGNINDYNQVSNFLRNNLYNAKHHPDFVSDYEIYQQEYKEWFWSHG